MRIKNAAVSSSESRILLTGVFGPFAQDDEYGSRVVNPMELYHNQVTRVQGPFSLRMFHRTVGLLMIEANIDAPCTILDFPTLDRFIKEIKNKEYDIIGISSIIPNVGKVKKMCEEIRRYQPKATIVVGGHIANLDHLEDRIDADHICKGDGIRWFRKFLGQDLDAPIKHPAVISGFGFRILGIPVSSKHTAAMLIPSVGCPVGCNFCSTSTLFGGKGNSISFYETGDELFSLLTQFEKEMGSDSFFVLDENFLLYKKRALRLLELMELNNKSWSFYIFSSARVLRSYSIEQLIKLGISWVWLGLEGKDSKYSKLGGVDTQSLVREFQENGIRVLGSTIIGMEEHTPENIDEVIQYAVDHDTDFHQFMLYTPMPGTPLYEEHIRKGTLLTEDECPIADVHGQERFNYRHEHIHNGQEKTFLLNAFKKDFEINGPSLLRIVRTTLQGWKRYQHHPDKRIVRRFKAEIRGFSTVYAAAIWAIKRWYTTDAVMRQKAGSILQNLYSEFGWISRLTASILGRILFLTCKKEARKLQHGMTYEPPVIYQKNAMALAQEKRFLGFSNLFRARIKPPAYDISKVVSIYSEKLDDYWIRLQNLKEKGIHQMEQLSCQIHDASQHARNQIQEFRKNLSEKQDSMSEQVVVVYERFKRQCEEDRKTLLKMRDQLVQKRKELYKEMVQLNHYMKTQYTAAQEQIDLLSVQARRRYQQACKQLDQSIEQVRQQIAFHHRQIKQLESI